MAIPENPSSCPFSNTRNLFSDLSHFRATPGFPYNDTLKARIISRYDDVVEVLDNPDIFSSKPTVPEHPPPVKPIFAGKVPEKSTLLNWDNPDHDRLRLSVSSFFVPRRLERFRPVISKLAHKLLDNIAGQGTIDLKSAFALPLPLQTISLIAGLDPERWEWIGRSLELFGSPITSEDTSIQDKVQGILDIHEYVMELIQARKHDRRDDLISHIWNQRDAGVVEMTDMEHLAMIPGLLLAGHETTTNVLSMGTARLLHLGLWDEACENENIRRKAIEELLRYESAIVGMRRELTQDYDINGVRLKKGDQIFAAYISGSRDQLRFQDPDIFDMHRQSKTQHLGFGRGVHACLGAPLARLLLRIELDILHQRLPNLQLLTPYEDIEYHPVREGRGVKGVEIRWDATKALKQIKTGPKRAFKSTSITEYRLVIEDISEVAHNILQFTLRAAGTGINLPKWTPGAHIDIAVGNLGFRQYSLCSNPCDTSKWQIAVLLEQCGLGGSKVLHGMRQGEVVTARGPRNHFALEKARRYIFIAGGIGITPIRPMVESARQAGAQYKLIYLGNSRECMAYADELEKSHPAIIWPKDEKGRYDLSAIANEDPEGLRILCCGPERLTTALEDVCASFPLGTVKTERFQPASESASEKKPFDVELRRSGTYLHIPSSKSLLEVLNENGRSIMSTCSKGTCGTCEVPVLEGVPEHRDSVLTPLEKIENMSMMACVSRCRGDRLVLDLW